jgi:nitrogen fixation/metabolism regulation signal transduction histidine kinase
MSHVRRAQLLAAAAAAPALILALVLLRTSSLSLPLRALFAAAVIGVWLGACIRLGRQIAYPLQTVANLLAALREGDFSIRARSDTPDDALGTVMAEINELSDTLRDQRLGAQEATALLRAVMAEIDVAILAFDSESKLALINRYGERLFGRAAADLAGSRAGDLGLDAALTDQSRVHDLTFPGGSGRWEVRQRRFWQGGAPHELVVLADMSQPLRAQEREAWLRLIRVIGHELNNSLTPIKSIAGSLESLLARDTPPDDWRADMQHGLSIIGARAGSLSRFTTAYAQLAKLPAPTVRDVPLVPLVARIVSLNGRERVVTVGGPELVISADSDQIEQLLINLLRNALEAACETGGGVAVSWTRQGDDAEICIEDEGPGIQSATNLFVPFFTTKPGGSGIGLVLSRQIAETHGGSVALENRTDVSGTRARVRLPLAEEPASACRFQARQRVARETAR